MLKSLILKAFEKGHVALKYPTLEEAEVIVREEWIKGMPHNENLCMILANCMTKKEILVVTMPSKVPATFIKLCKLDAVLDAVGFASEALAKTRTETQGQLAANTLVMGKVSDTAVLLDELDVIFTQELMVSRVLGFNTAHRTQILEILHAETEMLTGTGL